MNSSSGGDGLATIHFSVAERISLLFSMSDLATGGHCQSDDVLVGGNIDCVHCANDGQLLVADMEGSAHRQESVNLIFCMRDARPSSLTLTPTNLCTATRAFVTSMSATCIHRH